MKISKYNSIIKIGCKNLLYNSLSDCFASLVSNKNGLVKKLIK